MLLHLLNKSTSAFRSTSTGKRNTPAISAVASELRNKNLNSKRVVTLPTIMKIPRKYVTTEISDLAHLLSKVQVLL